MNVGGFMPVNCKLLSCCSKVMRGKKNRELAMRMTMSGCNARHCTVFKMNSYATRLPEKGVAAPIWHHASLVRHPTASHFLNPQQTRFFQKRWHHQLHRKRCRHQNTCIITSAVAASNGAPTDLVIGDVVIVGAGIIGLSASLAILNADPSLSVILVDIKEPCAGATGAGQGYLWLAHRNPRSSAAWELALRSTALWTSQPVVDTTEIEFQNTGSILLGSRDDLPSLEQKAAALEAAGVSGSLIVDASRLRHLVPGIQIEDFDCGLLLPSDSQINGRKTAAALLEACRQFQSTGRFTSYFYEGCEGFATSTTGRIEGIVTPLRTIMARSGVIMAAGAWSGHLLAQHFNKAEWAQALIPRRGLLLEMPLPTGMQPFHYGLMEWGYTKHYNMASSSNQQAAHSDQQSLDITFTATISASGTLLLGSSREFVGWDTASNIEEIKKAVIDHAATYLPKLKQRVASTQAVAMPVVSEVRVGLRPYSPTGPMIGPVTEGLYIAAGHEGSGLTLAPATSELLVEYVLGHGRHALSDSTVSSLAPPKELCVGK